MITLEDFKRSLETSSTGTMTDEFVTSFLLLMFKQQLMSEMGYEFDRDSGLWIKR